jgi:hypothetical protein
VFAGSCVTHFSICGAMAAQCGQAYEKNSMTSTLSGLDVGCAGVSS